MTPTHTRAHDRYLNEESLMKMFEEKLQNRKKTNALKNNVRTPLIIISLDAHQASKKKLNQIKTIPQRTPKQKKNNKKQQKQTKKKQKH